MKLLSACPVVILCLAVPSLHAQTMSHEEEVVRNTYAKLTFLCEVDVLSKNIAMAPDGGGDKIDGQEIETKMKEALPVYELSNFQVGDVSSIRHRPLSDFESTPASGQQILRISGAGYVYGDPPSSSQNVTRWGGVHLRWEGPRAETVNSEEPMSFWETASVQKISAPGTPPEPLKEVIIHAVCSVHRQRHIQRKINRTL